jgi:hypothetical protein
MLSNERSNKFESSFENLEKQLRILTSTPELL